MATYRGSGGKVTVGAGPVDLDATSWTMDTSVALAEVTELGATFKTYLAGFKDWKASVDAIQKTETSPLAQLTGTAASVKLYIDGTHYFEADGLIVSVAPTADAQDTMRISYVIEGADTVAGATFS